MRPCQRCGGSPSSSSAVSVAHVRPRRVASLAYPARFASRAANVRRTRLRAGAAGECEGDLYALLGVAPNATRREVKAAYRREAKVHHPDVGGDAERFKQVAKAYAILSRDDSRAAYDARCRAEAFGQSSWGSARARSSVDETFDFFEQGGGRGEDFYGLRDLFRCAARESRRRASVRSRLTLPRMCVRAQRPQRRVWRTAIINGLRMVRSRRGSARVPRGGCGPRIGEQGQGGWEGGPGEEARWGAERPGQPGCGGAHQAPAPSPARLRPPRLRCRRCARCPQAGTQSGGGSLTSLLGRREGGALGALVRHVRTTAREGGSFVALLTF